MSLELAFAKGIEKSIQAIQEKNEKVVVGLESSIFKILNIHECLERLTVLKVVDAIANLPSFQYFVYVYPMR